MNGRCTADPLDHADDICEYCGDEFCRSCLITTRNGKGPKVCRGCAISNSGISGARSSKSRVSKSHIERAREALEEAKSTRQAKTFQFFDEGIDDLDGSVEVPTSAATTEPSSDESDHRQRRRFGRRRSDSLESTVDEAASKADVGGEELEPPAGAVPSPPRSATPATALIESGQLAHMSPDDPNGADPNEAGEEQQFSPEVDASETGTEAEEEIDDSVLTKTPTPPLVAGTSLADRLATTPTEPMPAPTPRSESPVAAHQFAADPFAATETEQPTADTDAATPVVRYDLEFPHPAAGNPHATRFEWRSSETTTDHEADPFDSFVTETENPTSETSAAALAPERSLVAEPAMHDASTQHSSAVERAPHPSRLSTDPTASPEAASVDIDGNGNWIPPVLRGMAPIAERTDAPLPKRRQED